LASTVSALPGGIEANWALLQACVGAKKLRSERGCLWEWWVPVVCMLVVVRLWGRCCWCGGLTRAVLCLARTLVLLHL
jgi:hypothetical protein